MREIYRSGGWAYPILGQPPPYQPTGVCRRGVRERGWGRFTTEWPGTEEGDGEVRVQSAEVEPIDCRTLGC